MLRAGSGIGHFRRAVQQALADVAEQTGGLRGAIWATGMALFRKASATRRRSVFQFAGSPARGPGRLQGGANALPTGREALAERGCRGEWRQQNGNRPMPPGMAGHRRQALERASSHSSVAARQGRSTPIPEPRRSVQVPAESVRADRLGYCDYDSLRCDPVPGVTGQRNPVLQHTCRSNKRPDRLAGVKRTREE